MARYAAKTAAALLPATAVAGLGMPAIAALVLLAVLVLALACWVIGSQDRTNRASQILLALRGTPAAQPVPADPPAKPAILRKLLLVTSRKKQRG
jgi:hypothetical protein